MTVAERMRRDGWRDAPLRNGDWRMRYQGVLLFIYQVNGGHGSIETHDDINGETYQYWERRIGLRDLSQRAKAEARKLARKRRTR